MKVAFYFDGEISVGGGFQQQLSSILELKNSNNYSVLAIVKTESNLKLLSKCGVETVLRKPNIVDRIISLVSRIECLYTLIQKWQICTKFEKHLISEGVDIVYFLSPSFFARNLLKLNYISTVWDLCHRDLPEFSEVRDFREFEYREALYSQILPKAVAVIVDSEIGKSNVVRRYGVDAERVFPISFTPSINAITSSDVDVRRKYGLNGPYIYYPAQFWSHKNHAYIIDGLCELKRRGHIVQAVFSGSNRGNLGYVLSLARSLGIEGQISYIGFAPNDEIYPLYKNSLALVMPSYFGPTNIPPLEAFHIGVPVIYSDLTGAREQLQNAALYCDLSAPSSLADHLETLMFNTDVRESLIGLGKERLNDLNSKSPAVVLERILSSFRMKMRCWKSEGNSRC